MRKIILAACAFFVLYSSAAQSNQDFKDLQKFTQFYNYLTRTYIDTVNTSVLVENGIKEMLKELDPHSAYVTAEEMKGVNESFGANFEGIGIEFNVFNDTVIVVNTIAGGPSEKVGLLPNDRIVAVGDSNIVGIKQMEVPKLLKGPKGTVVDISVARRGVPDILKFRIVRDAIPLNTVDAVYKVDDKTGYIKLNRFAASTDKEIKDGIRSLGSIEALILDLRGNSGGFMDTAVDVSGNFLKRGSLVVSMEGRSISPQTFNSKGFPLFEKGKLIILVDEFSASSSEIVAGAIQDWDRGLIIGRPTFGKGTVQRQFPLVDGSAVRITMARYHTPSGRVIQRPYEKGKSEEYYLDFANRFNTDSIPVSYPDSLKYSTLRSHRTVYGGGGITPDITVPRDTSYYSDYRSALIRNGVVGEFAIGYLDNNRGILLAEYPDFESFDSRFEISEQIISDLVALGEKRGVTYDETGMSRSRGEISMLLKALVAQRLWGVAEYYRVINKSADEAFSKALEVLGDWDKYGTGIFI